MMELQQLRYFVRAMELGSLSRAAAEMGVPLSTLGEELARLEAMVSVPLLRQAEDSAVPTEGGLAFFQEAQLALRHADRAASAAKKPGVTGAVSVGLTPTACSVVGMPLIMEARKRYPDVRLHIVESLSGHLASMLNARKLDLAVLYGTHAGHRWGVSALLEERLFLIQSTRHPAVSIGAPKVSRSDLTNVPLVLPASAHSLRNVLDAAFARARVQPVITAEVDSLAMVMGVVDAGLGATIQPGPAIRRFADAADRFQLTEISDGEAVRFGYLCSLSRDELSPAALAMRVLLSVCAREQVRSGAWLGARLSGEREARTPDARSHS